MNILKVGFIALTISFNILAAAAESTVSDSETERHPKSTKTDEALNKQKCAELNGSDRITCENEDRSYKPLNSTNPNAHVNQNKARELREDSNQKKMQTKSLNTKDSDSKNPNSTSNNGKPRGINTNKTNESGSINAN